jgi:hypothetical protein
MAVISRFLNVFVGTFLVFFFAENAYAGFEWKPAPPVVKPTEMISPAPALPKEEVKIEPFPVQEQVIAKQKDSLEHTSVAYEEIMGFGKDIPLVFALRQIVPAEYAFSFDDSVNQAQRVNWTGGKAWNLVLKEALSSVSLDLLIVDHTVWIRPEGVAIFSDTESHEMAMSEEMPNEPAEMMKMVATEEKSEESHEVTEPIAGMSVLKTSHGKEGKEPVTKAPVIMVNEAVDYSGSDYNPSYPRRKPMNIIRNVEDDTSEPITEAKEVKVVKATPVKEESAESMAVPGYYKEESTASNATEGKKLDPYEIAFWQAEKGDSLRETLMVWSSQAGVEMFWGADYDYRLPTAINMHGTFPDAVKSALTIYETSMNRPLGKLHPNLPEGPSVLVIENEAVATQ